MWKNLIQEYFNDLRTQKLRSFLTMFSIMWGTLAVVLLLSFGQGMKDTMSAGFTNAFNNVLMIYGGTTSKKFEGLPKGRQIRLQIEDIDLLKQSIPQIGIISPSFGKWGTTLKTDHDKRTTYMEGVAPGFQQLRDMYPAREGRFLNEYDEKYRRKVVFLGDEIAQQLFGDSTALGKEVKIDDIPFTVIGVMVPKIQTSMNNGPDKDRAIIPASTYKMIYGSRYLNHILVRPRSTAESAITKDAITHLLATRYKFDPTDSNAIGIWDTAETAKQINTVLFGIEIFLGVVGSFTLFIAGVGVANIMYVVVKERTREIGVKMAVGARKIHIMAQFISEALFICLIGGLFGLFFSWGIVKLVQMIPTDSNGPAQFLANPQLSMPIALSCVAVLVGIGLVSGVFPARKAANLDPVESLRYE